MPYHFAEGEDSYAPNTNARRGLAYLAKALEAFEQDPGLALAAYNGGINGASRPQSEWPAETQDYLYWGAHIYADAQAGLANSSTLNEWMESGGASLCAQAERRLAGLP
jgi:soluble lytic murein transglycosylase-like protein